MSEPLVLPGRSAWAVLPRRETQVVFLLGYILLMDSTSHVLSLVRRALDEFDDHPLEVSVRRAVRIASLIGDSHVSVRLGMDLQGTGGDPVQNRGDLDRLMADSSRWDSPDDPGPATTATREYIRDRMQDGDPDKVLVSSLANMKYLAKLRSQGAPTAAGIESDYALRQIEERVRLRTFSYLVAWERRFGYVSVNESIFGGYKTQVDKMLTEGVPDLVEKFTAVYRRLNEAAINDPAMPAGEELSHALTSCRRILEAVVDHVLPPRSEPSETGNKLDKPAYRNRLFQFIKEANASQAAADVTVALGKGLYERYTALGGLANKGVHASVALKAANLCALNTYVLCGEILLLQQHAISDQEPRSATA
ncbi:hypothetical protein FKO01_50540 [Mesorhizobium sp. B2-3-3]|uniref:hypothetical protein n=1 Tax=[Kitasatospora] papulosa TaxID=1464011 RepID=UPI00116DCBF9|nr:hypothetical protein FKO01_50540 [Mesorhizobium sp. B2-3-3]